VTITITDKVVSAAFGHFSDLCGWNTELSKYKLFSMLCVININYAERIKKFISGKGYIFKLIAEDSFLFTSV
jgi:hypothetical protein